MKKNILLYFFIFLLSITSKVLAEQPIETILAKAMKAAENYSEAVEEYDAEIYMRIYVETIKKNYLYRYTHFIPKFVLHDRNSNEGLIEVLGDLKFQYPNNYTADITHLFSTFSQKKVLDMLPSNLLHINVYNEMSSSERFFMPLREASKKYYTYKLERTYTNDNITYYTISFTPIYKAPKLLEGRFVIEDGSWRVTQLKCEGVDLALDFSIELNMGEEESTKLLPVDATIYQKFSYLGNVVTNRNIVSIDYRTITLNDKRPKTKNLNISNFYKVRLDSVPLKNDSVFWEKERKIPLQARERDIVDQFYLEQSKTNSEKLKNDSLYSNRVNPLLWAKNMVTNTRYKYKSTDIDYSGAFNPALLSYSSFDGFSYGQKLNINYEFKRQSTLQAKAFVGFLFKRKELFTNISTTWNYNPAHLGKLTLSIGNGNRTYSSLFLEEIQDSLVSRGLKLENLAFDYYKDYYLRLYNTVEITNGFSIGTGVDFHIRDAENNKIDASAVINPIASSSGNKNTAGDGITKLFKRRNTFSPLITLTWTPEQYYRFDRRQKIYVRSPYPTMKLEFSKGVKGIFGSDSEYNRVEFDISQNIQLELMRSFQYHIGMGFFSNQKSEYFNDFAYFAKKNFPETWDDGIGGVFNLLNRQFYNASDSYIQTHFMYETPFIILNFIPALSKGVVTERLYFSQLYNPYIRSYSELGYGIGNRFLNAAVFGSFHKLKFNEVGFKVSLNIFK